MQEEFEEEPEGTIIPECPYCGDETEECEHLLLNYDASFKERLSGHLLNDDYLIEELQAEIAELLTAHKSLRLKNGYIKDIWDYAAGSFEDGQEEIEFDETAYFNLLDHLIDEFDGEAIHYSDDDNTAPGFCSAYIIFYAKDPEVTIQRINEHILEELKQAAQKRQDSKKPKKKIKLSVYWPDSWKSVILDEKDWILIQNGEEFSQGGDGYRYDGEEFSDSWIFNSEFKGHLIVYYDDGGVGHEGTLADCEVEEFIVPVKGRK